MDVKARVARLHNRLEGLFEAWGYFVCRWRWSVALVFIAFTLALGTQLPKVAVDNSLENTLLRGDPVRLAYKAFQRQFGQDEVILILVEPDELFSPSFFEALRAFHQDLERSVPFLDDITSLVNVRSTYGREDELVVEDLIESWPQNQAEWAELEARVRSNPSYKNVFIDDGGTLTTITLEPGFEPDATAQGGLEADAAEAFSEENFDPEGQEGSVKTGKFLSAENQQIMIQSLREVMMRHETPGFQLDIAGTSYLNFRMREIMLNDMVPMISLSLGANALFLLFLFRRLGGVFLPMVVVIASLVSTLGMMPILGIPGSTAAQMIPLLLLAVGICAAVHILTLVYQERDKGSTKEEAIAKALGHSGLPVLMTSLTTAGGLLSFLAASLREVANTGVIAPIGVMFAFLFTVTLLPALLAIFPMKCRNVSGRSSATDQIRSWLVGLGKISTSYPRSVLFATLLVIGLGGLGFLRFEISNHTLLWFPETDAVRTTIATLDEKMGGSNGIEIVFDTGKINGLHQPETLNRIDEAIEAIVQMNNPEVPVGKALSIIDIVKETHQALNANDPSFYRVPQQRALVAQELLLFENSGSDDMEDFVDSEFRNARVSLRIQDVDGRHLPEFMTQLNAKAQNILGEDVEITITGVAALLARTYQAFTSSMMRSYTIALLIISPFMIVIIGSLRRSLLCMVPNLLPIYLTLGFMGLVGIPLDLSSLMVGCIIIGLAVDDTIHFMHGFARYYRQNEDVDDAVRQTLETTGMALLFTSLVLSAGFLCNIASYMHSGADFGIIAAFATMTAFLADVLVMPALLKLTEKSSS